MDKNIYQDFPRMLFKKKNIYNSLFFFFESLKRKEKKKDILNDGWTCICLDFNFFFK